ncbi:hypothetical protein SLEP1_g6652 [Rubroshorea leprosula]|uniref:Uncharacterized protein n=1 Tax=Rubroshorea leprosula TaxID=152421 RepID=A0AAV5I292_9ROSI|nr:hypothetical protein SLEP1_g6652 [Rubroshorea leprosula]
MDSTYSEAHMGPTQSTAISQEPSLANDDGGHATSCTVNLATAIGDQIAPYTASIEQQEERGNKDNDASTSTFDSTMVLAQAANPTENSPSSHSHPMIKRS